MNFQFFDILSIGLCFKRIRTPILVDLCGLAPTALIRGTPRGGQN